MLITPAKKQSVKDAVIESLQKFIVGNNLQAGDSLPPETFLAKQLGVSRNSLREAMQYFRSLGIIDSRPRTGAYVKTLLPEHPFEGYLPYIDNDIKKMEAVGESRMILELGVVSLLIERASSGDIESLREVAMKFEKCKSETRPEIDIAFHSTMLEIAGNEIIMSMKSLVVDFFVRKNAVRKALNKRMPNKSKKNVFIEHLNIVDALERRNEENLRNAIREHYRLNTKGDI
ncbi:MAG: FadR/GntR family transcriptional regulator [Planctomycetota bacterium]|jgi:DNA-binding FadR family transcriptional regulator